MTARSFTDEEIAFIRQVAREMLPIVAEDRRAAFKMHLATCPYGKALNRALIVVATLAAAGGAGGGILVRLLAGAP